MRSEFESRRPAEPGEYIVEVIGQDGLKHHVGPFKCRADAEAWIAQNPCDAETEARLTSPQPPNRRTHIQE